MKNNKIDWEKLIKENEEYEQKEQEKKVIRQFAKRIAEQEDYNLSSSEIDLLEGMIHRTIEKEIRRFLRA